MIHSLFLQKIIATKYTHKLLDYIYINIYYNIYNIYYNNYNNILLYYFFRILNFLKDINLNNICVHICVCKPVNHSII